jgi:hypothetical protein
MANISFSTPFTKSFVHANHSVTTTKSKILDIVEPSDAYNRRVTTVIQNKSTTTDVDIIFNPSSTVGITLLPSQSISLENYNGVVFAKSASGTITVHTATASV